MKKKMFQILHDMNMDDIENKTELIQVSNTFVSGNLSKRGSLISMGATKSVLMDIHHGKLIPMLILVDKEEYTKRIVKEDLNL